MAIIRNEKFNSQGVVTSAQIIDDVALTLTPETNGIPGTTRPLTPDEIAAYVTAPQASKNQTAIETNLNQDMVAMQTIIDTANASIVVTTLPQAQQAARDALTHDKDIARMLKRLGRTALKDYTGTT